MLYPVHKRSFSSAASTHDSPSFRRLLDKWFLTDFIHHCMPKVLDSIGVMDFHEVPYVLVFDARGSVVQSFGLIHESNLARLWATATLLDTYGLSGIVSGRYLTYFNPDNPVLIEREPRVFLDQPYATARVELYVRSELDTFELYLESVECSAEKAADAWDILKLKIARQP